MKVNKRSKQTRRFSTPLSLQFLGAFAFCSTGIRISNLGGVTRLCNSQLGVYTTAFYTCMGSGFLVWTRQGAYFSSRERRPVVSPTLETRFLCCQDSSRRFFNFLRSETLPRSR
jgi:hypothetical protein